jgi:predicted ABC-type exoprotein transport system permease subunit
MPHVHVVLDPQIIALLGLLLPMVTALVTSRFADSAVKAIVLLLLAAVAVAFKQIVASNGAFDLGDTAWTIFLTFLTAVGLHFGLLAPVKVTGSGGVIQRSAPGGIGGSGVRDAA